VTDGVGKVATTARIKTEQKFCYTVKDQSAAKSADRAYKSVNLLMVISPKI
jgi:hypothetical protein